MSGDKWKILGLGLVVLSLVVVLVGYLWFADLSRQLAIWSSSNMRHMNLAMWNYSIARGNWPETLEAIRPYTEGGDLDELLQNPLTGDNPGYQYVRPTEGADPETTIVLYQLRTGKRDTSLAVGFMDGDVGPIPPGP